MKSKYLLLAAVALAAGRADAVLVVTQTTDIVGGRAAFGTSTNGLDYASLFPAGTVFVAGNVNPRVVTSPQTDPNTGTSVSGRLDIGNYIDGVGFGTAASPRPDLALGDKEDFTFDFTTAVQRIGFAAATGLGIFPTEFNNAGATFLLTTDRGETGTLVLVDSGDGYAAYVTITAATPFTRIAFVEQGGASGDQYFGDLSAAAAAVPEPATWATMALGFGLVGGAARRRRPLPA